MSVQSSINNMLVGFGYLTGQNAGAKREERQYKLEEKIMGNSLSQTKDAMKRAKSANNRAVKSMDKAIASGVDPLTSDFRKLQGKQLQATNKYGKSFIEYQRALGRYSEATQNYSKSIVGKTNKRAMADIMAAKEAENLLENTIPAGESVTQNLNKVQDDFVNNPNLPEIPEEFWDAQDYANFAAMDALYNTTSIAMNQNEALKERFGYKRNG